MSTEVKTKENVSLQNLLKDSFSSAIEKNDLKVAAIVFIRTKGNAISPIIVSHETPEDADKKIVSIMSKDTEAETQLIQLLNQIW